MDVATRDELARETWGAFFRMFMSPEVHDRLHDACYEVGLPHPGALKALMWLEAGDPPSMRAMAAGMHCDASYVTGLVDALEGLHYVERRVSPIDRRVKLVQLTTKGIRARQRALDLMLTPPKGFGRLTDTDVRSLHRLLSKAAQDYDWR